jgi:hypothetical protein
MFSRPARVPYHVIRGGVQGYCVELIVKAFQVQQQIMVCNMQRFVPDQ